jgi:bacterioferritin (cytochrome b1)
MTLLSRFFGAGETRDLVADLAEDYRAEAEQAAYLRLHAGRARYKQAAEALNRMADIEARHAGWLRDRINVLGGTLPTLQAVPPPGSNQWERAVSALQAAQRKRKRLIEQIAHWDPDEPEIVELLRRIEAEDTVEQATYEHLIMRSDPHAID